MIQTQFLKSPIALAVAISLTISHPLMANEDNPDDLLSAISLEDLMNIDISTGTRRSGSNYLESAVPVDILTEQAILSVPSGDLQDVLQVLSPSYNVARFMVNDGDTHVRTPTLRGLPGGEALILVNGKRLHRSALISLSGDMFNIQGAHAVDISQIPKIGVKRIEILRDGAAAQYGSDALAGVINIILHDEVGLTAFSQWGEYADNGGDGDDTQFGIRGGVSLGDNGHATLSAHFMKSEQTFRGEQAAIAIDAINTANELGLDIDVLDPAIGWGNPDREWMRLVYNAKYSFSDTLNGYVFGNYGQNDSNGSFFYRNPFTNSAFNRSELQDDPDNPIFPDWDLRSRYPAGFTPRFYGEIQDFSFTAGLDGTIKQDWNWDFSYSTGKHEIDYILKNSINPSLGPESPSDFRPGSLASSEQTVNFGITIPWQVDSFHSPINVAFGSEYRKESYEILAGDPASYSIGKLTDLAVGSNGFQGYSPEQAGEWSRDSVGLYVDLEADVSEKLLLGVALRHEEYSDFGSTTNGKIMGRYKISDQFLIRGAASTGFRAPTAGQSNMINTATTFENNELTISGIFPPTAEVSVLKGGKALQPEESTNLSLGLVYQPSDGSSFSLDYYRIDIDGRIGLSSSQAIDDATRQILITQGVAGAETFGSVRYFANGYDSKTTGFDISYNHRIDLGDGKLDIKYTDNYNNTEIVNFAAGTLDTRAIINIENMVPNYKRNLTFLYVEDKYRFKVRGNQFGSYIWTESANIDKEVSPFITIDVALEYAYSDTLTFSLGANNVFNQYPDEYFDNDCCGRIYASGSPYDTNGAFYFFNLKLSM